MQEAVTCAYTKNINFFHSLDPYTDLVCMTETNKASVGL